MRYLLGILFIFLSIWLGFFVFYVLLDFMLDKKYINYPLRFEEAFRDAVYPACIIVFFKILLSGKKMTANKDSEQGGDKVSNYIKEESKDIK
ncbi:hypothetical protein [Glaesserella parasuis]|uniref:hypothetical protein n=1 Tax=Glaesserella parasuis TaxID=738 RepID=UPI001365EB6B|nr:hypothetical protein [Glaesserella parasuis]MDG6472499.1 hypothetical protein [Glaesserella parasuis]MDO9732439.1 hypothetical protein [Glaesserella parasuis]MDO9766060.1 hypothetical protein [Glaesserella parasuis]MDO9832477.1 hypothetical protein [Glaesserella parasuis]MDP0120983.1 hypothetical protein [Glaesserella parasuis]